MFLRGEGTGRLILVTGGARAGKSSFALALAEDAPVQKRLYVATAVACDAEMRRRIRDHRASRNGLWKTLEESLELPKRLPQEFLKPGNLILLDCLPTFVTNHLLKKKSPEQILKIVSRLLSALRKSNAQVVLVSNEVGLGLVPENKLGRTFRDLLGLVNQEAARQAAEVYLLVAGIPMKVK